MRKRKIYDDKLQIDYFSDSYLKFEEDFYRYSAMDIPLTFLTDDIMREMAISQKNYFLLNKEITSSSAFRRLMASWIRAVVLSSLSKINCALYVLLPFGSSLGSARCA